MKKNVIWILRFQDGYMRSFYGTKEEAEDLAEERKRKTGIDYIIA